jgi:calcium-dependent protein kinase
MGNNCCNKRSVITINSKKPGPIRRRSSILLEKYSKQSDYKKKYEFVSILGNGGFGKVRLYRDRNCTEMKYAIKTLKKDFLNPHGIQSLIQEVKILVTLDHPNIVKYFETYEDDYYLHIVMEYIPGDNLFKVISNRKMNGFSEKDAAEILSYLLKAVLFLHKNKIVHRDIKPENILFSLPGKYTSLKLIDFGLSTSLATKDNYRVGSPYYMAPEMLKGEYDYSTDTWSIGVILFVMITGTYPFPGKDQNEVFDKIRKGVYDVKLLEKQKASEEVKDLIKKLVHDISKRLPIGEALNHPWFTKNLTDKDINVIIDDNILDSISNFVKRNLLQKEILFYLAKISSESEITKLKQAFSEFDKDKSGTIESEEIINIFEKLGKKIDMVIFT